MQLQCILFYSTDKCNKPTQLLSCQSPLAAVVQSTPNLASLKSNQLQSLQSSSQSQQVEAHKDPRHTANPTQVKLLHKSTTLSQHHKLASPENVTYLRLAHSQLISQSIHREEAPDTHIANISATKDLVVS